MRVRSRIVKHKSNEHLAKGETSQMRCYRCERFLEWCECGYAFCPHCASEKLTGSTARRETNAEENRRAGQEER